MPAFFYAMLLPAPYGTVSVRCAADMRYSGAARAARFTSLAATRSAAADDVTIFCRAAERQRHALYAIGCQLLLRYCHDAATLRRARFDVSRLFIDFLC